MLATVCKLARQPNRQSAFRQLFSRSDIDKAVSAPFLINAEDARNTFMDWQKKHWFSPYDIFAEQCFIRPVLLPFWSVSFRAEVSMTARIERQSTQQRDNDSRWHLLDWSPPELREYSEVPSELLVFASYQLRRDYANAILSQLNGIELQPLSATMLKPRSFLAGKQSRENMGDITIYDVEMKRSIAWELAQSQARRLECQRAKKSLLDSGDILNVKNVAVCMKPLYRSMKLIYLPAFLIDYTYGKNIDIHGERYVQRYQGLVSGLGNDAVMGERHVSLAKLTSLAGATTAATSAAYGLIDGAVSMYDILFSSASIGSLAALVSQLSPVVMNTYADEHVVAREKTFAETIAAISGKPPPLSVDLDENSRSDLEWFRWEESNKIDWKPGKRKHWAERLLQAQIFRRRQKKLAVEEAKMRHRKIKMADMRHKRRQKHWGTHHERISHNADLYGPQQRIDYLGYYRVLGLDKLMNEQLEQDDIKRAFQRAAMQWHPDRHREQKKKQKAREKFDVIRNAYDILRDPELRRKYDLGKLRHPDRF